MEAFDRELKRLLDFGHLEKHVQVHLKNVYATLSMGLLAAAAGAYVHMFTNLMQAGMLSVLGAIGCFLCLSMTAHKPENQGKRLGFFMGFSALTGVGLGPLLEIVASIDESIVPTALLGTAVIFICFSLSALYNRDRKFLFMGGLLFSALSWLMMMALANLFLRSAVLFKAELYIGFLVMCAFILYDTQLIIEKRRRGDDDYIWHSVDLFIDFIQVFRRLLIILASRENDKKKRRQ